MSLTTFDRRLVILRMLHDGGDDGTANATVINKLLPDFGYTVLPAVLNQDLRHLAAVGGVTLREVSRNSNDVLLVVTLTHEGELHLQRAHKLEGVDYPSRPIGG